MSLDISSATGMRGPFSTTYLKGDGAAHRRLQGPDPFGDLAFVRREIE